MRPTKPIEIELGVPFITKKCASGILRTIVEILMYQRNQIPFVYGTLRTIITKLELLDENSELDDAATARVPKMHATKQRTQAKEAFYNAEILFDTIDKILMEHSTVREVMILFGRTIYTAKEAIVINLPPINARLPGYNHQREMNKNLHQIAKTLSLSDEHTDNMLVQDTTNMFVLIKPLVIPQQIGKSNSIYPLDEFQLPSKCVRFVINMKTSEAKTEGSVGMCEKFLIFEEGHETPSVIDNRPESTIETEDMTCWHQLGVVVKGFKPAFRKGCQLWE
uniref:Uncharacterized protein n=1 Tax=Anopheles atroparvus TaxID=41427 RepID=A0AAG5DND3_ANOAO